MWADSGDVHADSLRTLSTLCNTSAAVSPVSLVLRARTQAGARVCMYMCVCVRARCDWRGNGHTSTVQARTHERACHLFINALQHGGWDKECQTDAALLCLFFEPPPWIRDTETDTETAGAAGACCSPDSSNDRPWFPRRCLVSA